ATAAGYPDFQPDACLINRYVPGAKLSPHQDKDEPASPPSLIQLLPFRPKRKR
ncbi:alpha-ketoglutarate-dependent dioxygenase AlkB, partial [Escherichia coli]|uniref:alpha-ketoglutarate-dependent dioxygenase AlkB n=1 Tax=Escherichia coli TaxID=562 RepID=UPI001484CD7F